MSNVYRKRVQYVHKNVDLCTDNNEHVHESAILRTCEDERVHRNEVLYTYQNRYNEGVEKI